MCPCECTNVCVFMLMCVCVCVDVFVRVCYGWVVLFRGSIIRTPVMLMMKNNANLVQERIKD